MVRLILRGKSRRATARRLGVHYSTLARILTGSRTASRDMMERLADDCHVSMDRMLGMLKVLECATAAPHPGAST